MLQTSFRLDFVFFSLPVSVFDSEKSEPSSGRDLAEEEALTLFGSAKESGDYCKYLANERGF